LSSHLPSKRKHSEFNSWGQMWKSMDRIVCGGRAMCCSAFYFFCGPLQTFLDCNKKLTVSLIHRETNSGVDMFP
jgi:hypothetical protein